MARIPASIAAATAFLAFASPSFAQGTIWEIDPPHTSVQFSVRHMMISNVHGEFSKTSGIVDYDGKDLKTAKIDALIDVNSINTHEPQRDTHLKSAEFFDVAKFPTMKFVSEKVEPMGAGKCKIIGDLTIHGVTKKVTLDVEGPSPVIKDPHGNKRVGATATTRINRKDFGLTYNAALETGGALIGDEVAVTIDAEIVMKNAPAAAGKPADKPAGKPKAPERK